MGISSYVPQFDALPSALTPKEHLLFMVSKGNVFASLTETVAPRLFKNQIQFIRSTSLRCLLLARIIRDRSDADAIARPLIALKVKSIIGRRTIANYRGDQILISRCFFSAR